MKTPIEGNIRIRPIFNLQKIQFWKKKLDSKNLSIDQMEVPSKIESISIIIKQFSNNIPKW
jgi:hypothetical protein